MSLKTLAASLVALVTAVPAFAQEVNIYSYRQPELIQPLVEAFTEESGIPVNVTFLKKGLNERLEAEGARTPADLIFTVDISRLASAVDAGLTQSVTSEVLEANIPDIYRDPAGHWFGLTTRARIVYAAKDRVDPSDVTTYEDLADPKWKGRICTRSGTHVYTLGLISAVIAHHGEEAARAWVEGVKANLARKPQGNDRAQVKAIWAGECDISVGNTYYMGKMLNDPEQVAWAESVHVLFPEFEGSGTHVNVSGVAMTKHAPHPEEALAFMEYLSSPSAQEIYAAQNFEYPIAPGTEAVDLVKSWGEFTPDGLNLMEVAGHRGTALKIVQEVDFDG